MEQSPKEVPADRLDDSTVDCAASSENGEPDLESSPPRTSRDVLFEAIGLELVNAGVLTPAATFIADVRRAAGLRVSPREVASAVTQIARSGQPVSAESVANIAAASRGGRSQRQQRHADEWRSLGALLALRGVNGSPEGQRAFIGAARAAAGKRASDELLLRVALAIADLGAALEAETVGQIGKRLALSAKDLSNDDIASLVRNELRALQRRQSPREAAGGANRSPYASRSTRARAARVGNPGTRRWKPGGRRRRSVRPPRGR